MPNDPGPQRIAVPHMHPLPHPLARTHTGPNDTYLRDGPHGVEADVAVRHDAAGLRGLQLTSGALSHLW